MFENIQYIAIEGVLGAGKTSVVEILSRKYTMGKMLEQYEENPFLVDFYKDKEKFGFQAQMWFLLSRYRQINEHVNQRDLFHKTIISDFMFDKDSIFANINLDENELALYNKISDVLRKDIVKPDLIVYLQASTDVLMEHIAERGRPFEKHIDREYIESLNESYNYYFFNYEESPLLIVNINQIDFDRNIDGLNEIILQIEKYHNKGGTTYYNPLGSTN